MFEYEGIRRVVYDTSSEYAGATFVPVCPNCGRFVRADDTKRFARDTIVREPDATCAKCGRVEMPFEGFI